MDAAQHRQLADGIQEQNTRRNTGVKVDFTHAERSRRKQRAERLHKNRHTSYRSGRIRIRAKLKQCLQTV